MLASYMALSNIKHVFLRTLELIVARIMKQARCYIDETTCLPARLYSTLGCKLVTTLQSLSPQSYEKYSVFTIAIKK